jgi:hypothetical protein
MYFVSPGCILSLNALPAPLPRCLWRQNRVLWLHLALTAALVRRTRALHAHPPRAKLTPPPASAWRQVLPEGEGIASFTADHRNKGSQAQQVRRSTAEAHRARGATLAVAATLSSDCSILRLWALVDGTLVWDAQSNKTECVLCSAWARHGLPLLTYRELRAVAAGAADLSVSVPLRAARR